MEIAVPYLCQLLALLNQSVANLMGVKCYLGFVMYLHFPDNEVVCLAKQLSILAFTSVVASVHLPSSSCCLHLSYGCIGVLYRFWILILYSYANCAPSLWLSFRVQLGVSFVVLVLFCVLFCLNTAVLSSFCF